MSNLPVLKRNRFARTFIVQIIILLFIARVPGDDAFEIYYLVGYIIIGIQDILLVHIFFCRKTTLSKGKIDLFLLFLSYENVSIPTSCSRENIYI